MKSILSIALLAAAPLTHAFTFQYYCPDNLAHPLKGAKGCNNFSVPCKPGDTIDWQTGALEFGCKLTFYSGASCTGSVVKTIGCTDYYKDLGVNAKSARASS